MSDPYLLLASLLPSGPISAPPPVNLKALENFRLWFNNAAFASQISVVAQNSSPTVDPQQLEFSKTSGLNKIPRTNRIFIPAPVNKPTPVSGSQLYQQRKQALKAGKLHTRLAPHSFGEIWSQATKQPSYQEWKELLKREAQALSRGQGSNRLGILVGDSLSMWFPSELLPGGKFWLNQGISGENSGQVLKRLGTFAATRPDTIYVLAGINDLRQGATDDTILSNIRSISRRLKQSHPDAEIVVQSILPTRNQAISNSRIRNLNQSIISIAQQEGVSYLNLYPLFLDQGGQMKPELTTDGLHLNRQGYEVWQGAMEQAESWIALNRSTGY